jgi:manganese oxidase
MNEGERVRWYIGSLGTEVDLHTPHWHGTTVLDSGGHRTDVPEVLPGAFKVYDMIVDNFGEWIFHCHVEDHIAAGMMTTFKIN